MRVRESSGFQLAILTTLDKRIFALSQMKSIPKETLEELQEFRDFIASWPGETIHNKLE